MKNKLASVAMLVGIVTIILSFTLSFDVTSYSVDPMTGQRWRDTGENTSLRQGVFYSGLGVTILGVLGLIFLERKW